MAADQTDHMKEVHNSVLAGVAYTLPFLVWSLSQLYGMTDGGIFLSNIQNDIHILTLIQAAVISLYLPRPHVETVVATRLYAGLLLISIPWPFLAWAWLVGAANLDTIAMLQGGIMIYALILLGVTRAVSHISHHQVNQNLVLSVVQLAALVLVINYPSSWLTEIGL